MWSICYVWIHLHWMMLNMVCTQNVSSISQGVILQGLCCLFTSSIGQWVDYFNPLVGMSFSNLSMTAQLTFKCVKAVTEQQLSKPVTFINGNKLHTIKVLPNIILHTGIGYPIPHYSNDFLICKRGTCISQVTSIPLKWSLQFVVFIVNVKQRLP